MEVIPCLFSSKNRSLEVILMMSLLGWSFMVPVYGYDPMDPEGNITIRWDVLQDNEDSSKDVRISIINYQQFRQIEQPGWRLSWQWPGKEVIWNMQGTEATEQGNCSAFKGKVLPHCCERQPVIVDLLPGTPYNKQSANCCRGGVLSSMNHDSRSWEISGCFSDAYRHCRSQCFQGRGRNAQRVRPRCARLHVWRTTQAFANSK